MSRRTYEVVTQEARTAPGSLDEAVAQKQGLQRDVENIQEQLADRNRIDPETGQRLSEEAYSSWRRRAISALHGKQQQLREIKAWLAKNNAGKKSEWGLLSRAYKLLEQLDAGDKQAQVEALLDDIEYLVPGSFLQGGAEPLAKTG